MRHALETLRTLAITANKARRKYLGTLAEMLADADGCPIVRAEIRETVEDAGRDWYSDRRIAEDGSRILEDSGMVASEGFWSLAFLNALRKAAEHFGITPGEAYCKALKAHGERVGPKDILQWIPEAEEDAKPKRDAIEEAIAVLKANAEDPRVIAFLKA